MPSFLSLILVLFFFLNGCAAAGYVVSAGGTGYSQYKFNDLEKRIEWLERMIANLPDQGICE